MTTLDTLRLAHHNAHVGLKQRRDVMATWLYLAVNPSPSLSDSTVDPWQRAWDSAKQAMELKARLVDLASMCREEMRR